MEIILIIISLISITALVVACLAFRRTFKKNEEGYSNGKQILKKE
jgi:flagellar basal body-associated protein FliL